MIELKDFGNKYIFLPDATRGAVRGITNNQLRSTGTGAIVVNTLHLMISPTADLIEQLGGIHKYMNWDGPILSDSGGFQVFSLIHTGKWGGKIHDDGAIFKSPRDGTTYELSPEKSIQIQMQLDTDILVLFDDCRKGVTTRKEAEESVRNTLNWAERCKRYYEDNYSEEVRNSKLLTAVVQGANFTDLREECAKGLVDIGFDGYNFGGYLLDDDGMLVVEQLEAVSNAIPDEKPKYGMGVGKPEDIYECAKLGYTLFDTVLPTRNARHGTLYSTDSENGVFRIFNSVNSTSEDPIDSRCDCETCKNHSRAYLNHLLKNDELTGMALATIHNLRFYNRLIERMNESGTLNSEIPYSQFLKSI